LESKRDYYEVLGVSRDADQRTIKRAFLKLARTLHPDVNKEPDAEVRFKEVNEAYSVLSDERKRANYDQFGNPDGPAGFGSEYVDMSDIFGGGFGGMGDIFDSFFGGGGGAARAARTQGRDMGISLRITLKEAASGCAKTIAYDRLAPCEDCGGTGVAEGGQEKTCDRCHGSGRVVEVQRTIFGQMQSQTTCPVCHGTGRVVDKPCDTCQGEGRTPSHETVKVNIPAGVHSGQSLRVEGRGEAGVRGDTTGDLVVTVQVQEDERFERHGDDLYMMAQIDSLDAILGTTLHVDGLLDGDDVRVDVPRGCQYGQQVEVKGMGMPRLGSKVRGNLVVVLHINTTVDLTRDELEMLRHIQVQRSQRVTAKQDVPSEDGQAAGSSQKTRQKPKRKGPFRSKKK
jgi:molecular chaperone DnaJ